MPVYHRTQRLQVFGDKPEIEKLYGNRYRMVVRCVAANGTKAWYNANKAQIFADFGTLYDAQMSVDGIDARTGEAYPDMVLVENKAYIYGRSEEYLVEFTYETLTSSFVQETEDKVDFDLNGLKRLTRTIIAKDTVAYSSVVGTSTTGSSPQLTLAQVSEDQLEASQDGFKRIREVWMESGILSVSQQFIGGSATVQVQAFNKTSAEVDTALSEVTASHVLISEGESEYEGIKTSTYQYQLDESFTEDYELNGLKRISLIELSSTDFTAQTVGNISGISPTTGLYLGTQEIDNGGTVKLRESVWLEAGTISISRSSESDGVMSVTTVFFGVEGSTVGPVIAKKTDNFEGMPTISVTTLQDALGNSIVSGGENLVNQVSGLSPFSYPGVLDVAIAQDTFDGGDRLKVKALLIDAPAQCKVKTTTYFIFQTSNSIAASDYSYAGSDGLWSPNHWAAFSINAVGTFSDGLFNDSSTFRGYRSSSSSQSGTLDGPLLSYANLSWQGRAVLTDEEEITYAITVDQGPPNPTGNTYTLDVQITPAFDDVDGNQYYKKTIVVTDAIPTQPDTASLPYT